MTAGIVEGILATYSSADATPYTHNPFQSRYMGRICAAVRRAGHIMIRALACSRRIGRVVTPRFSRCSNKRTGLMANRFAPMQSKLLRTAVRVQPLMPGWRTRRVRTIGSAMCSTSGSTRSNSVPNQDDHATATAADSPIWLSTSVEPMWPSTARFTQP